MTTFFTEREKEYVDASTAASKGIHEVKIQRGDAIPRLELEIRSSIEEGKAALEQMELELSAVATPRRYELRGRLQGFQHNLAKLKKQVVDAVSYAKARDSEVHQALLSDSHHDSHADVEMGLSEQQNDRKRLVDVTAHIESQDDRITSSSRLLEAIHATTGNTKEALALQRQTIQRSLGNADSGNVEMSRGRKFIQQLQRQLLREKVAMGIVITILAALMCVLLYFLLVRTHSNHPSAATTPP